jgi:hypothetical protein
VELDLGGEHRRDVPLPDAEGLILRVEQQPVPAAESELGLVPKGTRYVTLFLVNQRSPFPRPEQDRGFIFQVKLVVTCAEDFVPRPNLRGARKEDDIDERVGNLQYRDCFEYAVGYGVSTVAEVEGQGEHVFCRQVATSWFPSAEVEKVEASKVDGVELRMEALAQVADGEALARGVGHLVTAYGEWIEQQASTELHGHAAREETAAELLFAGLPWVGKDGLVARSQRDAP